MPERRAGRVPAALAPAAAHPPLVDTEPGIPAPVLAAAAGLRKAMLVPVVTALTIGTVFVAVYLAAFHAPQAHGQPLGIAADDAVSARVESELNTASPGSYTFYRYQDGEAARQAVTHGKVPAALVTEGGELRLITAGAQGPSTISGLATAVDSAVGHPVPRLDVRPLVAGDTRGLSAFYAAFGVVLAGFLFAVSSYQIAPRLPLIARVASMAAFSAASGMAVALIAHSAMDALPAPLFTVALLVGLLACASAAAAGALLRLFGPIGMPIASVVLLIFGNATSGGILPATYLPAWLAPLADVLAPAATIRGLRGAAYFHDAHLVGALLTLTAWIVGCLSLQFALDRFAARRACAAVTVAAAGR
ncbi:ABC transporter permease [Streptomyces sp. NPDC091259]|uniref:ABC transporter permease n=1 Tax=Streptomyces sp. NPDC091259 TaxID=3365976 RepID=UPI0037FAC91D